MLKIKELGLFILLLLGVNSCKLLNSPPKHPKIIEITWDKSAGMLPLYSKAYISNDSCVWENYNGINLKRTVFRLSEKEINDLYSVFYTNQFTEITSSKQEVVDRGGSNIYIRIDKKKYQLLNSGTNFIQNQFINNYKAIEDAIILNCKEANSNQTKEFKIYLNKSITNSTHNIVLYLNNKEIYNEQKTGEFTPLEYSTQDNSIHFKVLMMKKTSSSFQTVLHKYELILQELPLNNHIILTLVDGNLILK